jgi:hypothetical protein
MMVAVIGDDTDKTRELLLKIAANINKGYTVDLVLIYGRKTNSNWFLVKVSRFVFEAFEYACIDSELTVLLNPEILVP